MTIDGEGEACRLKTTARGVAPVPFRGEPTISEPGPKLERGPVPNSDTQLDPATATSPHSVLGLGHEPSRNAPAPHIGVHGNPMEVAELAAKGRNQKTHQPSLEGGADAQFPLPGDVAQELLLAPKLVRIAVA